MLYILHDYIIPIYIYRYIWYHIYLDLQSGTFTGSGARLPTPAFFWIWSVSFSESLYVDSEGFAFFVVRISLKVSPLLMQWFCLQSVLVCLFRCFLIPPVSAWFTLDQSDPFRWSSKWNRMKSVQCDARVERPKWVYLSWKNIGKDVLPLFQDVGALGYN